MLMIRFDPVFTHDECETDAITCAELGAENVFDLLATNSPDHPQISNTPPEFDAFNVFGFEMVLPNHFVDHVQHPELAGAAGIRFHCRFGSIPFASQTSGNRGHVVLFARVTENE